MNAQIEFKDWERLLWGMVRKAHRRVYAAGAQSVQAIDMFQEAAVAWCKARDAFDTSRGVPFEPFLIKGVRDHLNRWIMKELRLFNVAPIELDREQPDDERSLNDRIADTSFRAPDEVMIEKDMREYLHDPLRWRNGARKVSERTLQYLEFLAEPPAEILNIVAGLEIRNEYARERGVTGLATPHGVTRSLVFDLMGASRTERLKINKEVEALSAEISKQ